ncbi:uncharacterized protein LOC134696513 [Mytilus trossulus]|uniref:uncharacterized protein LOC134696513 n=1 Tax=Mytilus trossulus TaxID=6551 RepID=UPI003007E6A6
MVSNSDSDNNGFAQHGSAGITRKSSSSELSSSKEQIVMIETDTGNFLVPGMIENVLVDEEGGVYNDRHMIQHSSSAKSVKSRTSRDVNMENTSRSSRDENNDTSGQPDLYQMMIQTQIMMQETMKNREVVDNTDHSESGDESEHEDVGMALGKLCDDADKVQPDACTTDMPVDDEDDFMQSLGDFLSSEDKLGPKVSNSLAGIVNTGMKQKVSEDKIKSMLKKYLRPENCEALTPVHVNLPIWKTLNRQTKNVDIMIQKNQGILCKGMVPQLTLMDKLLNSSKANKGIEPTEVGELLSLVKDSFVFSQMAYSDLNVKRRQLIKTNLRPCYRSLCPDNAPISDKLFGDSLVDKVKEVDIANRMGRKLGKVKSFLPATSTDNKDHRINTGFTANRFSAPYIIPENRFRFKSQNNSFRPSFSHGNDHFLGKRPVMRNNFKKKDRH